VAQDVVVDNAIAEYLGNIVFGGVAAQVEAPPDPWPAAGKPCVYFCRCEATGAVKIGRTRHLRRRILEISSMTPHGLRSVQFCVGGHILEKQLHGEFAADRLSGEWFNASPDLDGRIAALGCSRIEL
jgi:hypothetical protein